MKIERMCHVSSINLTFSVHPTIDNIQSKTNIQSTFYSVPLNEAKCFSPGNEIGLRVPLRAYGAFVVRFLFFMGVTSVSVFFFSSFLMSCACFYTCFFSLS